MDPVAFELGPLTIRWYGILVALGFLAGFQCLQARASRYGLTTERVADLVLIAMLSGVLGARLLYVVQNWDEQFRDNLAEIPRIDHGGLVFFGGFLFAALTVGVLSWRRGEAVLGTGDLFAPGLALGHAIGRIGCFLNGCCFGRPWSGSVAVSYPPGSEVLPVQLEQGLLSRAAGECLPVFPIQLVEAAVGLCVFAVLLAFEKRSPRRGQLFGMYLVLGAGGRFLVEFGRGDYLRHVGPFTPAQVICLVLIPVGVWLLVRAGRKRATGRAATAGGRG